MTIKTRWLGILAVLGIFGVLTACENELGVSVTPSVRDRVDTLQSGGEARTYSVHLPLDYETASSPVVVLFHGADGSGLSLEYVTGFDIDADQYGFLTVYPNATNATSNWAYGCNCTEAEAAGVDDVQFVSDLLDELDADYGINRDSVFVVGYAAGGLMAQKVVCEAIDSFIGLATVAATMSVSVAETCVPTQEIPVLMIQGDMDDDFPWNGALDQGSESLLAADTAAQFWATNNGCGDRLDAAFVMTDTYYEFDVYREMFDSCPADAEVILFRMDGAGHGWPDGDFNAAFYIGQFFSGTLSESDATAF